MATKDNCSFSKQSFSSNNSHTDNDNRYSNLFLNLKYGSPTFIPVHSSSKLSNEKRSAFNNYEEKAQSQSWNKSSKSCLNTVKLNDVAEKEAKKDSKKDNFSKITNKSTLSLQIAAYKNSSEVVATNLFDNKNVEGLKQKSLIEKQGNEKETFAVSAFFIQNPFEFPRQENTKAKEPEVSQFKLSQRLLSPNKASAMTTNPNLLTPFKATKADVESSSLRQISEDAFYVINEVVTRRLGHIPILKGDLHDLPYKVQRFVAEKAELMRPRGICICDGSQHEADQIISKLLERGMLTPLAAYENNYLCRTDPKDVARVESKTWMVTPDKYQTVTHTAPGVEPIMGHWMSPLEFGGELDSRFPGCMAGRIMYVIPFSMGPLGSPLAKIGVQLTDSNYVVLSMRIMTRVNPDVWEVLGNKDFVRCIHSVGLPRPVKQRVINHWPCNPERVLIAHRPSEREIWSFGSGYGGNSLLGKKCFALRIASNIAHDEGWLAEHMLIMGVTRPNGKEHFIAAAFPSACGKTNLAMLEPALPGWKVRCVGDDIAWMKFGEDGRLYAINPEAGFFGVAPGTSNKTNPMAVATFQKNSIFTNVAETSEGRYYWEGLEDEIKDKNVEITDWLGNPWKLGDATPAAHPNSRFAAPAKQCPIIHPDWESPQGVPIEAIIFGGRRPDGVPLVFETFGWHHGIFTGACLKSETTAAAEHKGKNVMHDPMAMRPFMGYNFGKYLEHWISLEKAPHKVPKIYHVNWFRKSKEGKFLWPGFGDNIRVIDWIIRRLDGEEGIGIDTAVGVVPSQGSINLDGLGDINWDELMSLPPDYWKQDAKEVRKFLEDQVGSDLPKEIREELEAQEKRIEAL